jgi:U4/U6 small nuclear ribonucleoprotein PRP4
VGWGQVEVLGLTASSQAGMERHQAMLLELEAKKIASSIDVPTLPEDVRTALRNLRLPVRLFGENLANVRDRLRMELALRKVGAIDQMGEEWITKEQKKEEEEEEEEVTKYTQASPALVEARQAIARFSLQRAAQRLHKERQRRFSALKRKHMSIDEKENDQGVQQLEQMDRQCAAVYKSMRKMTLEGSQYGDSRSLSCIVSQTVDNMPVVATGSWTGTLHLWDGTTPVLNKVGERTKCHEDRIMGIDMQTMDENDSSALICTTSIDMTAKLWRVHKNDNIMMDDNHDKESLSWSITEEGHLKGHAARLCRSAFHPMKRHVATTSFDHSWRLWDIEKNDDCLLLQDGHWKEVYGIGFHPDGSLVATTDFGGVIQLWDLRTGKSIRHFLGHAKRVLNADFHPSNGFQLATCGDDGTIKIWDLRKRKLNITIPAHSNIVTKLSFDLDGAEFMASSSFDGTVKIWNTRNWKMVHCLKGHEGQVSGVNILKHAGKRSILSCGFDKTLKMWN